MAVSPPGIRWLHGSDTAKPAPAQVGADTSMAGVGDADGGPPYIYAVQLQHAGAKPNDWTTVPVDDDQQSQIKMLQCYRRVVVHVSQLEPCNWSRARLVVIHRGSHAVRDVCHRIHQWLRGEPIAVLPKEDVAAELTSGC